MLHEATAKTTMNDGKPGRRMMTEDTVGRSEGKKPNPRITGHSADGKVVRVDFAQKPKSARSVQEQPIPEREDLLFFELFPDFRLLAADRWRVVGTGADKVAQFILKAEKIRDLGFSDAEEFRQSVAQVMAFASDSVSEDLHSNLGGQRITYPLPEITITQDGKTGFSARLEMNMEGFEALHKGITHLYSNPIHSR